MSAIQLRILPTQLPLWVGSVAMRPVKVEVGRVRSTPGTGRGDLLSWRCKSLGTNGRQPRCVGLRHRRHGADSKMEVVLIAGALAFRSPRWHCQADWASTCCAVGW